MMTEEIWQILIMMLAVSFVTLSVTIMVITVLFLMIEGIIKDYTIQKLIERITHRYQVIEIDEYTVRSYLSTKRKLMRNINSKKIYFYIKVPYFRKKSKKRIREVISIKMQEAFKIAASNFQKINQNEKK